MSVVIPCYNEQNRILNTLKKIKEYSKQKKDEFEIIVVDDASTDKTVEIVQNFDSKIKILKNNKNMGKGYSVKRGILESVGDISLFMDADSSTEINELDKFLPYFENYDIVIGSRHLSKDSIKIPQGKIRRFFGFWAHKVIHLITKSKVKDTMCGFKAFNRKSKILFNKQLNMRWGFDYEIIFLAEKLDFKIKEIPVKWKDNHESKVTVGGYLKALYELFAIRINDLFGKYK